MYGIFCAVFLPTWIIPSLCSVVIHWALLKPSMDQGKSSSTRWCKMTFRKATKMNSNVRAHTHTHTHTHTRTHTPIYISMYLYIYLSSFLDVITSFGRLSGVWFPAQRLDVLNLRQSDRNLPVPRGWRSCDGITCHGNKEENTQRH